MLAEASPASRHDDRCPLIEVRPADDDGPVRLLISGDIDEISARHLQQCLIDVLRRDPPRDLGVDVSGVTFLDAAGIEALLRCQADARQLECRLFLAGPTPMTYRVLQIAGLLEQFGLAKSRPDGPGHSSAGAELGLVNCGLTA
jgi:anti-sigma B factor antagonist